MQTITQAGVQTLTVSNDNPLYVFNLDLSLEWDATNDGSYLDQLTSDLQATSAHLYDWSNGQVALGDITLYQDKENWHRSDVVVYASNALRPNADVGGIISAPR